MKKNITKGNPSRKSVPNSSRRQRKINKNKILWGRLLVFLLGILFIIIAIGFGGWKGYQYYLTHKNQVIEASQSSKVNTNRESTSQRIKHNTVPFQQEALDKPMYVLYIGVNTKKNNEIFASYLVAINKDQKNVDIIGIPTNSKIVGRNGKGVQSLSTMYGTGGIELSKAVVEDIFHIQIPYFIVFNENSFEKISSVIGYPSLYVESNFSTVDTSGHKISLFQGYQKMNWEKAWTYNTYVSSNEMGSEQIQRQERYLKQLITQENNKTRMTRAIEVLRYWDTLETNISTWDAFKYAFSSSLIKSKNYHYYLLPGTMEVIKNSKFWNINPIEAQQIIGLTLTPKGDSHDK